MGTPELQIESRWLNINCWCWCWQERVPCAAHGGCEAGICPSLWNHSSPQRPPSRHKGRGAQLLKAHQVYFCLPHRLLQDFCVCFWSFPVCQWGEESHQSASSHQHWHPCDSLRFGNPPAIRRWTLHEILTFAFHMHSPPTQTRSAFTIHIPVIFK